MLYIARTMYIDDLTYSRKGKTYRRVLLRHSYREGGKTRQRNLANLSHCSEEEILAVKFALKNKNNIDFLRQISHAKTQNWKIAGPSVLLHQVTNHLGINKALGREAESNYILWQVFARLIHPGSRLGNIRLARSHCGCELLGISSITENDLYKSLVWLHDRKGHVEDRLFRQTIGNKPGMPTLFLYDVSSSYFEGQHNELASYGYNRDKKKGKKQLVYGLLTDDNGEPLSIEAFRGNTRDPDTLKTQIEKIKDKYDCQSVAIVGDKGMIKSTQIKDIQQSGLNYITTITKPQIEALINKGIFQLELFTDELAEVTDQAERVRYILRRNPLRAEEIKLSRQSKFQSIEHKLEQSNRYLAEHPRAKAEVQKKVVTNYIKKLKMDKLAEVRTVKDKRELEIYKNESALEEAAMLDGCYVIKTDLVHSPGDKKEEVHSRYKSLALVEWAFRTEKSQLGIRPIFLRKEHRTKAHLMVCMLAYKIEKYLRECWKDMDVTVEEGIEKLCSIVGMKTELALGKQVIWLPEPDELNRQLLSRANVTLPTYLPTNETIVSTNEKLTKHRKRHTV